MKKKEKNNDLIDWYKKIPDKYLTKTHNPHFKKHNIKLSLRAIICGATGTGKTQTLMNLIHVMKCFEKIFIITKNKDEPIYNYVNDTYGDLIIIKEGIENLPNLDDLDKNQNNLVVLDDMCNESKKSQQPVCDFAIRCRKKNCSLVYISQSYYQVPKLIRDNINYLFLKQVSSMKNLTMICRECSLGIEKKQLKNIYEDATKTKQDFLLIDLEGDKEKRFRKNFNEVYAIDDLM